jgi:flavin-dependent dehydrogenase
MARNERILIVGGGIAGLTAAIALRRRGFALELVERAPFWRALGTGIVIQPNAMRLLRELDVASGVEKTGAAVRRFQFLNGPGEVLSEVDLNELWSSVGAGVTVERGESCRRHCVTKRGQRALPSWRRRHAAVAAREERRREQLSADHNLPRYYHCLAFRGPVGDKGLKYDVNESFGKSVGGSGVGCRP